MFNPVRALKEKMSMFDISLHQKKRAELIEQRRPKLQKRLMCEYLESMKQESIIPVVSRFDHKAIEASVSILISIAAALCIAIELAGR